VKVELIEEETSLQKAVVLIEGMAGGSKESESRQKGSNEK
jgi:hypothetical protein